MKRNRVHLAVVVLVALGISAVILWRYLERAGDMHLPEERIGSPDDRVGSTPTDEASPDDDAVTFPTINTWDAPLVPLESPGTFRVYRKTRSIDGELEPKRLEVTWRIAVTEEGLATLRKLEDKQRDELTGLVKESYVQDRETLQPDSLTAWAMRVLLMADESTCPADRKDVRRLFVSLANRDDAIDPDLSFEDLGLRYYEDGWLYEVHPNGIPLRIVPLFPSAGQRWEFLGGPEEAVVRRQETIALNGGRFRCWVISRSWETGSESDTGRTVWNVKYWYAPGVGRVRMVGKHRTYRRTLFGRQRLLETGVYRDELREVLLPEEGLYWRAEGL